MYGLVMGMYIVGVFFFSSRRRHTRLQGDWSSDVCSSDLHLGFTLWEHIVEKHGLERAREVMRDEDDFGFIRNCLDRDLAEKAGLFVYEARPGGELRVASRDLEAIREAILAPKYNYGAPRVAATELKSDGTLVLTHEHASDGRGLDAARAKKVLEYTRRAWRRAVRLHTVNERGEPLELAA